MKTLILNVDRDDDFGRKANVKSPIIGIKDNINAANKLGQADPEDSDLNAIFSAISIYNKFLELKKDVEIATICGDINVGIKSDEKITQQLEQVIKETKVDDIVLVTDGVEDEYVLPIIQSRIKITSINKVSVKQSRELEDTYYRVIKILEDEKVQKQFVLPIALVLIVGAIFVLLDMAASGFGAILLTLGLYLLIRVFRWERILAVAWSEIKSGFFTGRMSIFTYIIAFIILIATFIMAYYNVNNLSLRSEVEILRWIFFLNNIIWGVVIACLVALAGHVADVYVKDKKLLKRYWPAPFSLFAFGFISSTVFGALYEAFANWPKSFDVNPFFTMSFIGYTFTGVMIALSGLIIYHYVKEINELEEKKIEIEKKTIRTH
jgi:putative membrane protein